MKFFENNGRRNSRRVAIVVIVIIVIIQRNSDFRKINTKTISIVRLSAVLNTTAHWHLP